MKKKRLTKKAIRELRKWVLELLVASRDAPSRAYEFLRLDVQKGEFLLRMWQIRDLITEYRKAKDEIDDLKFRAIDIAYFIQQEAETSTRYANRYLDFIENLN